MRLSIVIPFHNEEKNVKLVIGGLLNFFEKFKIHGEIVAIDDRSTDDTGKLLESLSKKINSLKVIHRSNGSKDVQIGYAIRAGIVSAKGEIVTVMMGDNSDNPNDIIKMIKKIDEGYDVVCGSRLIQGSRLINYPLLKLWMMKIYNSLFSFLFGLGLSDFSNAFKSYRKKVFDKIKLESKEFEITAEMLLKAHIYGFKVTEVPVSWVNRASGESKLGAFSFSPNFIFLKLPRIGWRYGILAIKLYFNYLAKRFSPSK